MKFWRNLQPRLAMLVVAAIIPLLVLSMLKAWLSADAAVSRANDNLRSAVSLVAASQAQVESSAHQILMAIAHAPGLVEGKVADCQRYFKTLNDEFAVYVNLGLIGLDGANADYANLKIIPKED